ncbi:hypothetical protein SLA2020_395250 [Shorea laevis]
MLPSVSQTHGSSIDASLCRKDWTPCWQPWHELKIQWLMGGSAKGFLESSSSGQYYSSSTVPYLLLAGYLFLLLKIDGWNTSMKSYLISVTSVVWFDPSLPQVLLLD